jgi:hypothetical protein
MVWAGYAFAQGRTAFGLWITTPPGFTIEAAFLLVRRHDRARGHSAPSLITRLGQEGVIGLAGGVMVLSGYAGAVANWLVGAPIILLGLPIIAIAVWLGRRRPGSPGNWAPGIGNHVRRRTLIPRHFGWASRERPKAPS